MDGASQPLMLEADPAPRTLWQRLPFWWSHVLFAGRDQGLTRQPSPWPALALLLAVASLLFLTQLRAPLLEPQEARYAEIPRQMLAEGHFVVPVLHGQPYLDKPPLLYWLVMASYCTFGVADWAARLIPGLAGVLTVLIAYLWGRRVVGQRAALWGALVLCLSARFVYLGRMLNMDGLLCFCVTTALAAAHIALTDVSLNSAPSDTSLTRKRRFGKVLPSLARQACVNSAPAGPCAIRVRPRWRWWLLSAVACALGVLTKGPVALILVGVPLVLYRLLDPRCPRLALRHGLAYIGVVLALAGPWYIAAARAESDFTGYFFWTHNVVRFLAPFDHAEPVWYFLPSLLLGLLPWTLLLPGLLHFMRRRSERRPPALGFLLLAFVSAFAFFSASGCKRPAYILPAIPPLALALGCYLDAITTRGMLLRGNRLAFTAAAVTLTVGLGIVLAAAGTHLIPPLTALILAATALTGLALLTFSSRAVAWPNAAIVSFVVLLAGIQFLMPAYNDHFGLRSHLRAHVAQYDDARLTVICYPQRWDSVSFYLPDAEVKVYSARERQQLFAELRGGPRVLLAAKSGKALAEIVAGLPEEMEFVSGSRDAAVIVGWVRPRGLVARR